jgi:hypothetical protein
MRIEIAFHPPPQHLHNCNLPALIHLSLSLSLSLSSFLHITQVSSISRSKFSKLGHLVLHCFILLFLQESKMDLISSWKSKQAILYNYQRVLAPIYPKPKSCWIVLSLSLSLSLSLFVSTYSPKVWRNTLHQQNHPFL